MDRAICGPIDQMRFGTVNRSAKEELRKPPEAEMDRAGKKADFATADQGVGLRDLAFGGSDVRTALEPRAEGSPGRDLRQVGVGFRHVDGQGGRGLSDRDGD